MLYLAPGFFFNLLLTVRKIFLSAGTMNSPTSDIMKKYVFTALVTFTITAAFAQQKPTNPPSATDTAAAKRPVTKPTVPPPADTKQKKDWSKVKLDPRRPQDHFMVELGYDNWVGSTDSMNIKGFNHSENVYFMNAWPFKTDARFALAAGIGLGSSNIFFAHQEVMVAAYANQTLAFPDETGGNHFKKYKLVTTYLEIPVELRFSLDPEHMDHSWKFAVGAKIGLMLSAYTKGTTLVSATGQVLGNYAEKESSKQFFSTAEFTPTIRISKGFLGFFAQIHANPLIKASAGPSIFPLSGGVVLSGL
jgi:outer membrane protein with beta-barrel domain